jgi:hypothetical protein
MVLKGIAEQTLAIIESGRYRSEAGLEVIIGPEVARAVDGTVLYRPGDYDGIQVNASERQPVRAEVTNETTTAAARRLIRDEGAEISETPRRRALQMLTASRARNVDSGRVGMRRVQKRSGGSRIGFRGASGKADIRRRFRASRVCSVRQICLAIELQCLREAVWPCDSTLASKRSTASF